MPKRKQLIEQIMADINAMKYKMHFAIMRKDAKKRVTHSQWFVVCLIEQHKNLGVKEISNMLGITSSATTQLIDGLVKSGYVKRKTNTKDRRSLQIELSSKGKKHIKEMKRHVAKAMERFFKPLSDRELKMYNELHKKILTSFNKP